MPKLRRPGGFGHRDKARDGERDACVAGGKTAMGGSVDIEADESHLTYGVALLRRAALHRDRFGHRARAATCEAEVRSFLCRGRMQSRDSVRPC